MWLYSTGVLHWFCMVKAISRCLGSTQCLMASTCQQIVNEALPFAGMLSLHAHITIARDQRALNEAGAAAVGNLLKRKISMAACQCGGCRRTDDRPAVVRRVPGQVAVAEHAREHVVLGAAPCTMPDQDRDPPRRRDRQQRRQHRHDGHRGRAPHDCRACTNGSVRTTCKSLAGIVHVRDI